MMNLFDIECKTHADCNKLSNTGERICQVGRCLRNKMIIQSYFLPNLALFIDGNAFLNHVYKTSFQVVEEQVIVAL